MSTDATALSFSSNGLWVASDKRCRKGSPSSWSDPSSTVKLCELLAIYAAFRLRCLAAPGGAKASSNHRPPTLGTIGVGQHTGNVLQVWNGSQGAVGKIALAGFKPS
jgi:hypothetical protein